jgi:predicted secreted hydrolase
MGADDYSLSLEMNAVKPPVWHCDDGVLKMGVDNPMETTNYGSYTNLKLILGKRECEVSGKAWFDKRCVNTFVCPSRYPGNGSGDCGRQFFQAGVTTGTK